MEVLIAMLNGKPAPARVEVDPGKVYARASTVGEREREAELTYAMKVIADQAGNGLNVNEVVEELNMSRSTLHREFINTIGRTPSQEIARVRLERAKEMLGKTKMPIWRIATMLGYPSQGNFTTFFKTQTGMTPLAFRIAGRTKGPKKRKS
jgi:LacI family transcriptional regulator